MSSRHEAIEKAARVAVPVETLREAVSTLSDLYMERGDERCAKAHNALSKLLPPPPKPEPSAELRAKWEAEAKAYWSANQLCDGWNYIRFESVINAYVAAAEKRWRDGGEGVMEPIRCNGCCFAFGSNVEHDCVTAPPPVDWQAEARKAAVAIYAAEVGREGLEGVDLKRQAIMATEHVAVLIAAMRANPKEFGT